MTRTEFKHWLHNKENVIICPGCGMEIVLKDEEKLEDDTKKEFIKNLFSC